MSKLSYGTEKRKYPNVMSRYPEIETFLVSAGLALKVYRSCTTIVYPILVKATMKNGLLVLPYDLMMLRYIFVYGSSPELLFGSIVIPFISCGKDLYYLDIDSQSPLTLVSKGSQQVELAKTHGTCASAARLIGQLRISGRVDKVLVFGYLIYCHNGTIRAPKYSH